MGWIRFVIILAMALLLVWAVNLLALSCIQPAPWSDEEAEDIGQEFEDEGDL